MMGRMMKLLRSFPLLFQPLNYSIRRRLTKKRNNNEDLEYSPSETPTLRLPPISRSKSTGLNYGKTPPLIQIRRARSQNKSSMKMFSSSETNLSKSYEKQRNFDYNEKSKSISVANNLNITNNNSIITSKNTKNSNNNNYYQKGGSSREKDILKRSESKVKAAKSDIPQIVAEVISEATTRGTNGRVRLERQMVRIINGADPSTQSQILLNTKTSQPWEELVRNLGMAVRLPHSKKIGNRLETLYGRQVRSYSQLRSELKVGNSTFYIYVDMDDEDDDYHNSLLPNLQRQRLSITPDPPFSQYNQRVKRSSSNVSDRSRSKISLTKTLSNSSSELSNTFSSTRYLDVPISYNGYAQGAQGSGSQRRRHRRRSQTNSLTTSPSLHLPQIDERTRKRSVSPVMHRPYPSNFIQNRTVHFQN